jgi:hypothetical protein
MKKDPPFNAYQANREPTTTPKRLSTYECTIAAPAFQENGAIKMEYSVNADQVIAYIEEKQGRQMNQIDKALWKEVLVPIANEAYKRGYKGKPLDQIDWIKEYKEFYHPEPDPKMCIFFRLISKFEKGIYEEGRRRSAKAALNCSQEAGVSA